jgi:hypothetical protein
MTGAMFPSLEVVLDVVAKVEVFRGEVRGQLPALRAAIDGAADYREAA